MTEQPPPEPATKPTRRIDAKSLRTLAHPLRMAMLEALNFHGPATATGLARRLGENTGTVSWHLRQLAEHNFIEEETGRGTKRERWWRTVKDTKLLNAAEFQNDPEDRGALDVYFQQLAQQLFTRTVTYLNEDWGTEWKHAATLSDWRDLTLTPDQLSALNRELFDVIARHAAAGATGPAGPEASPVVIQIQSFPRKEADSDANAKAETETEAETEGCECE